MRQPANSQNTGTVLGQLLSVHTQNNNKTITTNKDNTFYGTRAIVRVKVNIYYLDSRKINYNIFHFLKFNFF
jgi:hypothetical protein